MQNFARHPRAEDEKRICNRPFVYGNPVGLVLIFRCYQEIERRLDVLYDDFACVGPNYNNFAPVFPSFGYPHRLSPLTELSFPRRPAAA